MHFIVKQIFKYFLHFALPITHDFSCYKLWHIYARGRRAVINFNLPYNLQQENQLLLEKEPVVRCCLA